MSKNELIADFVRWISIQAKIYHRDVHGISIGFLRCEYDFCVSAREKITSLSELL